ncbi:MAG: acyl-ACP--UDP-N-acetylglucosamine O-acyltransferase, partial [Rudaea sp.]
TDDGGGATRIGNGNWIMAYVHIAHDCRIGSHTVFSNNATLAGHVEIDDYAILSGFAGVHQFCRVGAHAFIGMNCMVNGDVPPFVMMAADYGRPRGINSEGLKRRGFTPARLAAIKRAYRTLYVSKLSLEESRTALAASASESEDVRMLLEFIERGQRPLAR